MGHRESGHVPYAADTTLHYRYMYIYVCIYITFKLTNSHQQTRKRLVSRGHGSEEEGSLGGEERGVVVREVDQHLHGWPRLEGDLSAASLKTSGRKSQRETHQSRGK